MTKNGPRDLGRVRNFVAWKAERRAKIKADMAQANLNVEGDCKTSTKRSSKFGRMSYFRALFVFALATFGLTGQSHSLSLTNSGDEMIKVIVAEAKTKSEIALDPDQEVSEICMYGCIIKLPNGDQEEFEGDEVVEVDEGGFTILN